MERTQVSKMDEVKRTAFTLLELLVVVAIVSMLVAILLPAVSAAKQKTLSMRCQENLRQIGAGFNFYASASNDCWPKRIGDTADVEGTCWPTRIDPYLTNAATWMNGLWLCPNNTPRSSRAVSVCYGMVAEKFESHVKVSQVPSPENSILLGEGRPFWDIQSFSLQAPNGLEPWLHDGWVNLLYADLHVQSLETERLQSVSKLNLPWDIDLNG